MRVVLVGLLVVLLGVLAPRHSAVAAHEAGEDDTKAEAAPLNFFEKISGALAESYGRFDNSLDSQLGLDTAEIWKHTLTLGEQVQLQAQNLVGHVQDFAGNAQDLAGQRLEDVKTQFKDTAGQISAFQQTLADAVSAAGALRADVIAYTSKDTSEEDKEKVRVRVEAEFGRVLERVMEEVRAEFPPPEHAPSHAEREAMVEFALGRVSTAMIDVFKGLGVGEENVEKLSGTFDALLKILRTLLVIIGDLAEQHPQLLKTLLISAATFFVPQAWILGKLLGLFGFGVQGPVKGTAAAWAQRAFFGAMVPQGSWFAKLQKLGMTLL